MLEVARETSKQSLFTLFPLLPTSEHRPHPCFTGNHRGVVQVVQHHARVSVGKARVKYGVVND